MKKFLIGSAMAIGILTPVAASAQSVGVAVCYWVGSIASNAAYYRQMGMTQQSAANALAVDIADVAGELGGKREERQYVASLLGQVATHMLRVEYGAVDVEPNPLHKQWAVESAEEYWLNKCLTDDM